MDNLKGGFEITNGPIEENQILNDGGETIGEIENSVQTGGTETGILSYDKIMDEQKTKIKTYFGNSVEFAERMINEYNEGILSLYLSNRRYVDGKIGGKDARLIGKSKTISELLDKRFNDFIKIIENKEITIFETFGNNIPSNDIRKFIENYKNYIIKKKSSFSSRSNEILGALIKSEETLIKSLNKTNFIFNEKFDGKIIKKDEVKAFKLKVNEPNFEKFQ